MNSKRLASALACGVCIVAMAAPASAQTRKYDIPAGSLKSALNAYGRQSGRSIIYKADQVGGAHSPGVRGAMSPEAALDALLSGTTFHTQTDQSGEIAIVADIAAVATPGTGSHGTGDAAVAAADQNGATSNAGEIVVTASKIKQRLIDVPMAVGAVRAADLTQRGAVRLEDFTATVPGVEVQNSSTGGGQTRVIIRGIITGGGGNPTVAVYIDDTPITSATGLGNGASFPDLDPAALDRIEVLRGPQGTLYGASSLGGLLKYVTRKPDFDQISGHVEMGFAAADHGGPGADERAQINLPLSDKFALTASGFYRLDPGFIDDVLTGKRDVNTSRADGGRLALAFRPIANFTITASVLDQNIKTNGNASIDTDLSGQSLYGDLRVSRPPNSDGLRTNFLLADLRAAGSFTGFDLVSDTSYGVQKTTTFVDYTKLVGSLLDEIAGQTNGTLGATIDSPLKNKKFTQEVRANSTSSGFLGWQVGIFYTHENLVSNQKLDPILSQNGEPAPAGFAIPQLLNSPTNSKYNEIAGFGDVTLKFTRKISLTGGLRYSHIDQRTDTTLEGILVGPSTNQSGKSTDNKLTFLVNPVFKLTPDAMVYGRIASGYRPGGPNITPDTPASYGPDTVISYEIGSKAELLNRSVTVDVSGFIIDWNKIQLVQTTSGALPLNFIGNAGSARSQGIEAAVTVRPFRGLMIDANGAYTDAKLTETTSLGPTGSVLPLTPKWAGQAGAEYRFQVSDGWAAFAGASVRTVGRRLGYIGTTPADARTVLPRYETVDLRAGATHHGFAISAYLRNVADKRGFTSVTNLGTYNTVAVIQPRTVGLVLSKNF